jgi:hypothetical protein
MIVIIPEAMELAMKRDLDKLRDSLPEQYHNAAPYEQGFVDRYGNFLTRGEAFELAEHAGQIKVKTGNTSAKVLYSEDLY